MTETNRHVLTSAPISAARKPARGLVRPFERDDVPAVARLFNLAFRKAPGRTSPKLEAFFEELFFNAPCQTDTTLRSYVYEDHNGRVGGFVGTHPRSLLLDGRRVVAAAYGQLMVAPELQGRGIGFRLVERFYQGGQEYSFCGSAAPATRAINERLGGVNPEVKGLSWRKSLRPARAAMRRLARSGKLGPLRHLARVWPSGTRTEGAIDQRYTPDLRAIETVYERAFADMRFHPVFEREHITWKLRTAAALSRGLQPARTFTSVVNVDKDPVGWYVWFLAADGAATVVELLCVPGHREAVVRHLLREAHAVGAESVGGLCNDASEADAVQSVGASVRHAQSTFVFHSQDRRLLQAFPDGPQHLSVFDGEGWIDFPP